MHNIRLKIYILVKAIFRKNRAGIITLPDVRPYYKATVIKIVQYRYKNGHRDQWHIDKQCGENWTATC